MSLHRHLLTLIAAIAFASPMFADDAALSENNDAATTTVEQTTTTTTTTSSQETKVNLNKATTKELMKIDGINATKARAIVAYRKKNGDFQSTDELSKVKGFKKMKKETLGKIQDQLTVE